MVWASEKTKSSLGDSDSEDDDEDDTASECEEGVLQDEQKDELTCLTLSSSLDENTIAGSVNVPQDPVANDASASMSDDVLDALRDSICQSYPGSLQRRQLEYIPKEEQRKGALEEDVARKRHRMQKDALLDKGISEEYVEMLPVDPDQEMPNPLQREVNNYLRE